MAKKERELETQIRAIEEQQRACTSSNDAYRLQCELCKLSAELTDLQVKNHKRKPGKPQGKNYERNWKARHARQMHADVMRELGLTRKRNGQWK